MSTGSITSASASVAQATYRAPEAAEVKAARRDDDGDADDKAVKASKPPVSPTVNANGQQLGQIINTSA